MLHTLRVIATPSYWKYFFSWKKALTGLLAAFGALFTIVKILDFYSKTAAAWLQDRWWLFVVLGVLWAVIANWPKLLFAYRLSGRDVTVELRVGDLFELDAALVIGSNTTFDTDPSFIAAVSVQGQFADQFYDSVAHMDADIEQALAGEPHEAPTFEKPGKQRRYPIGTVARLRPRNQPAYLVAIAEINPHGNAVSSIENIQSALPRLWQFVGNRGGTIGALGMPVLGTGFSRITAPREHVIREIVRSFVAACGESRFCDCLTIVIPPRDFSRHSINLPALGAFVHHLCTYTPFRSPADQGAGEPVGTPHQTA